LTTLKSKSKQYKGKEKATGTRSVQKSVVEQAISSPPAGIKFKLRFDTRWMGKTLSNDDTFVRDSNTSWIEVMKQMDAPIHKYCAVKNITDYMPYKIRAITALARASRAKEVSSITLGHADPEPWDQVLDLLQLNHTNGYKDNTITIDSEWTVGGRAPHSVEPIPDTTLGPSSQQGKRT
ncbi:hypothetical protein KCU64_g4012, partial [Aureobasidium melanogenum]